MAPPDIRINSSGWMVILTGGILWAAVVTFGWSLVNPQPAIERTVTDVATLRASNAATVESIRRLDGEIGALRDQMRDLGAEIKTLNNNLWDLAAQRGLKSKQ
jgi:hypothetical protein